MSHLFAPALRRSPAAPTETAPTYGTAGSPVRVLLVDDDVAEALITRQLLAERSWAGYEVDWRDTFDAAVEALRSRPYDVVLLDYWLDGRSGLELLQHVRGHGVLVPTILLTERADRVLSALRAGVADVLERQSLTAAALERSVRYAVEGGRAERERETLVGREGVTRSELEAAYRQTASVLESISDAFYAVDWDWSYTYVNAAGAALARRPREALLGQNLWEAFPETIGTVFEEEYRRAMHERTPGEFEAFFAPVDAWLAVQTRPSADGLTFYIRDVTARKAAEATEASLRATLETERTLFREVLQQLPIGVVIAELPSGRLTVGNAAVERIWGQRFIAAESVAAYGEYRGFHDDGRPIAPEEWPLARTIRTGERVAGAEVQIQRGDDTRGTMRISSALVHGVDGAPMAAVVTLEDVSLQRQAGNAVRFQAHLLDTVEQAVMATDLAGTVTYWNRHAETLYGWTAAEAVGRNLLALTPADTTAEEAAAIFRRLTAGESWSGTFTVRRKDGSTFPACVTDSPIFDAQGAVVGVVGISADITERLRVEEASRASEAFFRAAFVSSAVASLLTAPDGTILRVNPAFCEMLGYAEDELTGRPFPDFTHGEDHERSAAVRAGMLAGEGETRQFEKRYVGRDGHIIDGLVSVGLVRGPDGAPSYFTTQVVDLSDRKRAEAAVREREENLAAIVEIQQEVATSALDLRNVMRLVVNRARTLAGADGAAVAVREGDELVYRAAAGHSYAAVGARSRVTAGLAGRCIREGETLRWNDLDPRAGAYGSHLASLRSGARAVVCTPLFLDGRAIGVLEVYATEPGAFDDGDVRTFQLLAGLAGAAIGHAADYEAKRVLVAERTAALDALREREGHFRSLIDNAADPVMVVDQRGVITYASPAIERALGYTPEELVGTDSMALCHPDDLPRVTEAMARLLERPGQPVALEARGRHTDGSWRTMRNTARNLLGDPTLGGIVLNLHDVTDEKLLAQQLRQAQKLEAVGQLAGGVAHDFNNLLTVIKIHGEFLAADLDGADPRRADVEEIRKAAERAAALTRQLLAFSRTQVLQPKVLDLNEVVASITPMLRRVIGEDIAVATLAAPEQARVCADPGQLEQVLMNLAINARDAMPRGGALTIETHVVELDDDYQTLHPVVVPGPYVVLVVSDTGVGMDRGTRERIFEPFFTTKEPGKGTGLGLSTVYGIVKQSGGYVWVYSEPDQGTTFKIYLPRVRQAPATEPAAVVTQVPSGTEMVLLVEDEDAVRGLARRILVRQGYRVLEARHGADALALASGYHGHIHLVLTDVVMPQMSGRELVERLGAHRPGIRVVYMSGYTNDDIVRRGSLSPGSRRLLEKPFSAAALAEAVRTALDAPEPAPPGRAGQP